MGFLNNDGSDLIGGLLPSGVGEALQLDANGNLKIVTGGIGSPAITEDQIRAYILADQAFTAFINGYVTAGQAAGISLFANNIAKNILIFRISVGAAIAGSNCKLAKSITDFALGAGGAVAENLDLSSATTSLVTISSTTAGSSSGTIFDYTLLPAYIPNEILSGGECIFIPAGATEAIAAFCDLIVTTGAGFVSISWIEF